MKNKRFTNNRSPKESSDKLINSQIVPIFE